MRCISSLIPPPSVPVPLTTVTDGASCQHVIVSQYIFQQFSRSVDHIKEYLQSNDDTVYCPVPRPWGKGSTNMTNMIFLYKMSFLDDSLNHWFTLENSNVLGGKARILLMTYKIKQHSLTFTQISINGHTIEHLFMGILLLQLKRKFRHFLTHLTQFYPHCIEKSLIALHLMDLTVVNLSLDHKALNTSRTLRPAIICILMSASSSSNNWTYMSTESVC